MIQINKNGVQIPGDLQLAGQTLKLEMQRAYDANPHDYQALSPDDPVNKFEFDSSIYGSNEVKAELISVQNGKCCFCEAKMRHVSDGDVEHFRPKGRWKQVNGTPINYPGYYWKAYDWDNLFLACQRCNEREKQDLFPLEINSPRASNHNIDVSLENPMFLDPQNDDPEDHIEFNDQYIRAKSNRGKTTISELGLDRSDLESRREEKLDDIRALEDSMLSSIGLPNEERTRENFFGRLRHYVSGQGEYSNMFKCNFSQYLDRL